MNYLDFCRQGDQFFEMENYDQAIQCYDKAIAVRPQYVAALYRKGECLYRLQRFLESVPCFWAAYLFFQFRKEPLLMCGRALEAADFSFEACAVFSMTTPDQFDSESMIFYISALVREGRMSDAASLLPRIERDNSFNANLLRARVLHDFGLLHEAKSILEQLLPNDDNGKVADRLVGVYMGLGEFSALNKLLDDTSLRYSNNKEHADYYVAMKVALEFFTEKRSSDISHWKSNARYPIIDSACYLYQKSGGNILLTGASAQTFSVIKGKINPVGIIAEFGVRNGHSINLLAKLFPGRRIYGFDSFVGLPEQWNNEPAGSYTAGGKLPTVPDNVTLIDGWFDKTLPSFAKTLNEPLALLNVDCDIYSSTKTIFDELGKHIVVGTIIIFDEYINNKTWREDEFKAFQEWIAATKAQYEYIAASLYTKQVAVRITSVG